MWTLAGWLLVSLYGWRPGMLAPLLAQGDFLAPWLLVSLLILALTPLATLVLRRPAVLVAGALLLGIVLPLGMNRIAVQRSPKELGLTLKEHWQSGAALVGVYLYSQGLSFYSGQIFHLLDFRTELNFGERMAPESGLFLQNWEELRAFAATRPLMFFYLRNKDYSRLKERLPREFTVTARQNDGLLVSSPGK